MSNRSEKEKALCEKMTDLNRKLLKQTENIKELASRLNNFEHKEET